MNLELYNKLRVVPEEAKKTIQGGKLKGFTDVNPMWRIKILTQTFGVCGFGWKYKTVEHWTHTSQTGEVACFVRIELFVKMNGEWSDAIEGVGGSKFDSKNKNGIECSDECFKMATTDALSVACKQLGIAADVYFSKDCTKYTQPTPVEQVNNSKIRPTDIVVLKDEVAKRDCTMNQVLQHFKLTKVDDMTFEQFQVAMKMLGNTPLKGANNG